jgi:hypothetical protein
LKRMEDSALLLPGSVSLETCAPSCAREKAELCGSHCGLLADRQAPEIPKLTSVCRRLGARVELYFVFSSGGKSELRASDIVPAQGSAEERAVAESDLG